MLLTLNPEVIHSPTIILNVGHGVGIGLVQGAKSEGVRIGTDRITDTAVTCTYEVHAVTEIFPKRKAIPNSCLMHDEYCWFWNVGAHTSRVLYRWRILLNSSVV